MKAGVLYAKGDVRYADWPDREPEKGEIKVRMRACGICGSDIPRFLGDAAHFYPVVLGHEFSGEVVSVGEGAEGFKPGDRIAGAPLIPCMTCEDCQNGSYSLCRNYSFIGSREQGAFAEYVVLPARNAVKFPNNVTFEMGALFEPATVALHGLFRSGFQGGEDVAVMGTGNIGILTMQWARIFGAKRVAVFDIVDERLELAERLGADAVFNTSKQDFIADAARFTNSRGFGYVFETAGQPATIKLGYDLVSNNGRMTCIGTPHSPVTFDWKQWELLNRKEFLLTGTWMSYSAPFPGKEWELTAHYFANGDLKLDESMIFKKFPLQKIDEAVALFREPGLVKGKVIITNS